MNSQNTLRLKKLIINAKIRQKMKKRKFMA